MPAQSAGPRNRLHQDAVHSPRNKVWRVRLRSKYHRRHIIFAKRTAQQEWMPRWDTSSLSTIAYSFIAMHQIYWKQQPPRDCGHAALYRARNAIGWPSRTRCRGRLAGCEEALGVRVAAGQQHGGHGRAVVWTAGSAGRRQRKCVGCHHSASRGADLAAVMGVARCVDVLVDITVGIVVITQRRMRISKHGAC